MIARAFDYDEGRDLVKMKALEALLEARNFAGFQGESHLVIDERAHKVIQRVGDKIVISPSFLELSKFERVVLFLREMADQEVREKKPYLNWDYAKVHNICNNAFNMAAPGGTAYHLTGSSFVDAAGFLAVTTALYISLKAFTSYLSREVEYAADRQVVEWQDTETPLYLFLNKAARRDYNALVNRNGEFPPSLNPLSQIYEYLGSFFRDKPTNAERLEALRELEIQRSENRSKAP